MELAGFFQQVFPCRKIVGVTAKTGRPLVVVGFFDPRIGISGALVHWFTECVEGRGLA